MARVAQPLTSNSLGLSGTIGRWMTNGPVNSGYRVSAVSLSGSAIEQLENGRQRSLGRESQSYSGRENGYWHPGGEIGRRLSAVRDTLREMCSALPVEPLMLPNFKGLGYDIGK